MLNITEKRILKKQLQKLQKGWGRTLDKSSENRQITQLQIKRIAKQNYQLNKSIDIILKLM